jgi:hypothetical protein
MPKEKKIGKTNELNLQTKMEQSNPHGGTYSALSPCEGCAS